MLFEGKVTSQTQSLQAECADWVEQFPHLRVLGKQLLLPKDEGFQHFQSRSDTCVDTKCLPGLRECTSNIKELCISGSKLIPTAPPIHKSLDSSSTRISASDSCLYSFLEEEIYDVDGKIEEYLAFDNKELDDESWEQKKIRLAEKRSKRGIPPVSPDACIKDAVVSEVFDCIWSNVIGILEELIKKNWETNITFFLYFFFLAFFKKKKKIYLWEILNNIPRVLMAQRFSSNLCSDLNGVMTIQAKPLQQRHVATVEKIQTAGNSVLLSARVLLASSRKLPSHRRLPSLTSDQLSSKLLHSAFSQCFFQFSQHRGRFAHSRVSSAVPGSTERRPLRERTVIIDQFSRPNTTHTFRTDTPQKRSLTPMDFANHRGTGQGFLIGSQHYYRSFQRNPPASRKRFQIVS
uniref:Family with sequence similarity 149 member A n=1 Tax=Calidris pygmaea TaxID=425635 RepID=A0A8C3KJS6_9CHAR